jgi:hypothetical protein
MRDDRRRYPQPDSPQNCFPSLTIANTNDGIHALGWTEAELGAKFDIKGFHDLLIASGSQPMSILEQRVDHWIAARK